MASALLDLVTSGSMSTVKEGWLEEERLEEAGSPGGSRADRPS
ncbi:MAG: hypothetical protein R2787_09720 [Saprospiraceae bacterium]